jgi:hypothetical protein
VTPKVQDKPLSLNQMKTTLREIDWAIYAVKASQRYELVSLATMKRVRRAIKELIHVETEHTHPSER